MLDAAAVLIMSVLTGLGVGGGGLGVMYFALIRGMEQRAAQGMNLMLFILASSAAFAVNRKKRKLDMRTLALMAAMGCPAALLGSLAASAMAAGMARRLFGGFLLFLGIKAILSRRTGG